MSNEITTNQSGDMQTVTDTSNLVLDQNAMTHMMKVAEFMAGGTLTLPEAYRKNPANCLAVVMQAAQWKMNPYAVAQKTHFVNGNIGYEAQLVSAVIAQSGATKDNFHFEWYGDWTKILGKFKTVESKTKKDDFDNPKKYKFPDWKPDDEIGLGIRVWATLKGEDEPRVLDLLLTQANTRNSTLWADDPRQQLAYLAQKRWARLYASGVILGVYSPDEIEDMPPKEVEINPIPSKESAIDYLSDEEFLSNEAGWKKRYLRGKANGLTLEQFKKWVFDSTKKHLTKNQIEEIENWKAPDVIDGQATDVTSSSTQSFVDEMNNAEASAK